MKPMTERFSSPAVQAGTVEHPFHPASDRG